jgi:hypothetical protein
MPRARWALAIDEHGCSHSAKRYIPALQYPLVKFANVEAGSERSFGQPGGVK